ncbi:MAG: hypothetical protein IJJ69_11740 [Oscillospiraceae bacterium]|nr:hypothetical protein [Oscillospiraceae bacterium]
MASRKFKIFIGILLTAFLIVTVPVYLFRNSETVHPAEEMTLPDNVVYYSQKNPEWAEDTLGTSAYQMSDSGCLVTCIACALNMQEIWEINPKELNQLLSANQGYDEEGNLQWNVLEKLTNTEISLENEEIPELLRNHIYPAVRVRMHGAGSYHYVLIIGSDKKNYLCIDPLNQENQPVSLSEYGNRIYAVRYLKKSVTNNRPPE